MVRKLPFFLLAFLVCASCVSAAQLRFDVSARDFPVGPGLVSVVAGDFNRDGINDLAVSGNGAVYVLMRQANGRFAAPVSYAITGSRPWSIVTADFNRDGHLDLAVGEESQVDILLGKGDGTFSLAPTQPSVSPAYDVVTADFNRDGNPDLAVTDLDSSVRVLLGKGDGTFLAGETVAAGSQPLGIVTADLNNDHRPDLVIADYSGISVLFGQQNGTFSAAVYYETGILNGSPAVGDLNGDGYPDIVAGPHSLVALFGSPNGTFSAPVTIAPTFGYHIAIQDFNGDGKLDLAETVNNSLQIYLGNGDGTFTPGDALGIGQAPYRVIAPCLYGDRAPELVSVDLLTNITAGTD